MRRLCWILLAALALLQPAAQAQERRDLIVAVQQNPPTLDPATQLSNVAWRIYYNVFDTLIGVDYRANFRLVPGLATAWRRTDDRTLELTLREGVRFHNGDTMTAEDVAFTFGPERMTAENAPVRALTRGYLGTIERVEIVDARTVRFVTRAPDPLLEQRLATFPAQIVSKRAYLAAGSFDRWNQAPVGTGPYRVREARADEVIVLDAFDDYWGGRPNARSVRFVVTPEVATRVAGLRSGQFHIVTDIPPDQLGQIAGAPGLDVAGGPIANHRVLVWDINNPVLRDVRVRRALSLAIDRNAITTSLWNGRVGVPRSHQFEAYGELYFADWPQPAYDPDRARALLREAGYRGEPIEYRPLNNYYANEVATAQVLQEMWRAVGLNVVLQIKETSQQMLEPRGRGIRDWSNTMIYPDPIGALWRLYGAEAYVQRISNEWTDAEFNRNGAILESTLDGAARRAAWRRMLEIYDTENPPGTVLHQFAMFYGKRRDVDWQPLPTEWMDLRAGSLSFRPATN